MEKYNQTLQCNNQNNYEKKITVLKRYSVNLIKFYFKIAEN